MVFGRKYVHDVAWPGSRRPLLSATLLESSRGLQVRGPHVFGRLSSSREELSVPFAVAVDGLDDHRVHEQFRCIPLVFPASQAPLNSPAYRRRVFTTYGLRNLSTVHTLLLLLSFSVVGLQCFANTLVVQ